MDCTANVDAIAGNIIEGGYACDAIKDECESGVCAALFNLEEATACGRCEKYIASFQSCDKSILETEHGLNCRGFLNVDGACAEKLCAIEEVFNTCEQCLYYGSTHPPTLVTTHEESSTYSYCKDVRKDVLRETVKKNDEVYCYDVQEVESECGLCGEEEVQIKCPDACGLTDEPTEFPNDEEPTLVPTANPTAIPTTKPTAMVTELTTGYCLWFRAQVLKGEEKNAPICGEVPDYDKYSFCGLCDDLAIQNKCPNVCGVKESTLAPTANPTADPTTKPTAMLTEMTTTDTCSELRTYVLEKEEKNAGVCWELPEYSNCGLCDDLDIRDKCPKACGVEEPTPVFPTDAPVAPTDAPVSPTDEPAKCGCASCTQEVLDRDANGYSCGSRIDWVVENEWQGLTSEIEACNLVAGIEYPSICGPCDPNTCNDAPTDAPVDPTGCWEPTPPKITSSQCYKMETEHLPETAIDILRQTEDLVKIAIALPDSDAMGLAVRDGLKTCDIVDGNSGEFEGECVEGIASFTIMVFKEEEFIKENCEACNYKDLEELEQTFCAYSVEIPCESIPVECGEPTASPTALTTTDSCSELRTYVLEKEEKNEGICWELPEYSNCGLCDDLDIRDRCPEACGVEEPTPAPSMSESNPPTSVPSEDHVCLEDIEVVHQDGVTGYPEGTANAPVKIIRQDKETVTVRVRQTFAETGIDHMFLRYKTSVFHETCEEHDNVDKSRDIEDGIEITISCMRSEPFALLKLMLVDDNGGLAQEGDNATIPQCCYPSHDEPAPTIIYTIGIWCETRCVDSIE